MNRTFSTSYISELEMKKRNMYQEEPKASFWETDIKMEEAPKNTEPVSVFLSDIVRDKLSILMMKFHRMEWLAYLKGERGINNSFIINDIIIPKQSVSPATVSVEEGVNQKTIGVIHSHHDMGNFFSHTDDEYINQNHDLSLCITNKGITGQARVKNGDNFLIAPIFIGITDPTFKSFLNEMNDMISVRQPMVGRQIPVNKEFISPKESIFFRKDDNITGSRNIIGAVNDYNSIVKSENENDFTVEFYEELVIISELLDNIDNTDEFERICEMILIDSEERFSFEAITLTEEIDIFDDSLRPYEKKALVRLKNNINEVLDKFTS